MTDKKADWEVALIVPASAEASQDRIERKADIPGEYHAGKGWFRSGETKVKGTRIQQSLNDIVSQVRTMIETVKSGPVGDLELESIEVGLALSAEGTVGFATGGVEASITLSFKAPAKTPTGT